MKISYPEFDNIFNRLEEETSTVTVDGVDKYSNVRDIGKITMKEWLKVLSVKATDYMDEGYSMGIAMIKVWEECNGAISEDSEIWNFHILELRDSFFNDSLNVLELYEDKLTETRYKKGDKI